MKCEVCHSADAQTVIKRNGENGRSVELFVCKSCAEKEKEKENAANPDIPAEVLKIFEGLVEGAQAELSFAKDGAEALAMRANPTHPTKSNFACKTCGYRYDEFLETHRVGCEHCYETFEPEIAAILRDMHYGSSHMGKQPQNTEPNGKAFLK